MNGVIFYAARANCYGLIITAITDNLYVQMISTRLDVFDQKMPIVVCDTIIFALVEDNMGIFEWLPSVTEDLSRKLDTFRKCVGWMAKT